MKKSEIREIDIELIRELKLRGKSFEARELLRAYRENCQKEKEQLRKEIKRDYYKKRNFKERNSHNVTEE